MYIMSATWLIVVASDAELLPVFVSPPPETEAVLVTLAGAVAETLAVTVMAAKLLPAETTAVLVQVTVWPETPQLQFVPLALMLLKAAGKVSVTVTVPAVELPPELVTVIV